MHSKSSNYLGYIGTVRCTLQKNHRTIMTSEGHNNGTANLFSFLAQCITGDYLNADSSRPYYLKVCDAAGEELVTKPYQQTALADTGGKVVLSFMLEKNDSDGQGRVLKLAGKNDQILAEYTLTSQQQGMFDFSTWAATNVVLIDWQLEILNYTNKIEETNIV